MSLTLWQPKSTKANRLKDETILAILGKLHARYGAKFSDLWQGVPHEKLVAEWAQELAGYSAAEIHRGLDACRTRIWPPTLPEFAALCRPPIEAEAAYHEAVEGMRVRTGGKSYQWSHPGIYWAAMDFGSYDLSISDWRSAKAKWTRLLGLQMAKDEWPEIPAPPAALLPPPPPSPMPPKVREQLASLMKQMRM